MGQLAESSPLLENNPRSMKGLMNAYGIERDRYLREGHLLKESERRTLVLLTILRLRWPLLAEHLQEFPEDAALFTAEEDEHLLRELMLDPIVRRLFDGSEVAERLAGDSFTTFPFSDSRQTADT